MSFLEDFELFILDNHIVKQSDKLLLAVSGGKDSMLMAWAFIQLGFYVEIAHCNFSLRNEESDGDEQLVVDFAKNNNIVCHVKRFQTEQYADSKGTSIQMAARELRYNWFEELRNERNLDSIAIAQHKNDHVETILFNLSRGTGLKGLLGIQQKRGYIIRPLLFLESKDVALLVKNYSIPYRDDSSNFSNKYARNKIRLDIIPQFEILNPDFISIMDDNISRFQESVEVLGDFVNDMRSRLFVSNDDESWVIQKKDLEAKKLGLIYMLFEPYKFSKVVLEDLMNSLSKEPGRIFESEDYILVNDRVSLILKKKAETVKSYLVDSLGDSSFRNDHFNFQVEISDDCSIQNDKYSVKIDLEKLILPLQIRTWEEGDVFQPLGMKGKKKLSDLFIQRKVNVLEKKEIPLLVNGNGQIIWVVGLQLDDRYKITENTKKVLKLVFHKK